MLNSGNASLFNAPVGYTPTAPDNLSTSNPVVRIGDYDGDKKLEVAIAQTHQPGFLTFSPANTNSTLGPSFGAEAIPLPSGAFDMTDGLLDPDDISDLVMGGESIVVRSSSLLDAGAEASIAVYTRAAGDGGPLYMPSIAAGDFDEDGVLDLAAAVVQRGRNDPRPSDSHTSGERLLEDAVRLVLLRAHRADADVDRRVVLARPRLLGPLVPFLRAAPAALDVHRAEMVSWKRQRTLDYGHQVTIIDS